MDTSPRLITTEPPVGSVIYVCGFSGDRRTWDTGMLLRRKSGWTDMRSTGLARSWEDLTRIETDEPALPSGPHQPVHGCRVTEGRVARIEVYLVAQPLQDPTPVASDPPAFTMPDQRSTTDQLRDLVALANRHGMYDAADAVTRQFLEQRR